MSHHNHGKYTVEVGIEVIKHQRKLRMQSFNNYRKRFGLEPYKTFEEMTGGNISILLGTEQSLITVAT